MVESDILLKIRADTKQLERDIKEAASEKIQLDIDSIKGATKTQTDQETEKTLQKIKLDTEDLMPQKGDEQGGGMLQGIMQPLQMAMGGAMKPMLMALGPLAAIGVLVSSSKVLMNMLSKIMRLIQLIIKPIGDIIAVGLMPIVDILRPIGRFFNALLRPYIMKAREAMRAGGKYLKEGEYGKATEAYGLGFSYMAKPLFDLIVKAMGEVAKAPLRMMKLFGEALVSLGERLPVVGDAFKAMGNVLSNASEEGMSNIDSATEKIINFTNDALDNKLGGMLADLMVDTGTATTKVINKFERMGIDTSAIAEGMKNSLKTHLDKMDELSDTKAESVKDNVVSALDSLDKEAENPMSDFKTTVIGYLKSMKDEADNVFSDTSRLQRDIESRTGEEITPSTPTSDAIGALEEAIDMGAGGESGGTTIRSRSQLESMIGSIGNRNWRDVARDLGYNVGQVGIPYVPETAPYLLHRGERVLNRSEAGISKSPVYNISPTIYMNVREIRHDSDISGLADRLSDEIISNIRSRTGG